MPNLSVPALAGARRRANTYHLCGYHVGLPESHEEGAYGECKKVSVSVACEHKDLQWFTLMNWHFLVFIFPIQASVLTEIFEP